MEPANRVAWKPQRPWIPKPWPHFAPDLTDTCFNLSTKDGRAAWVQWHYCTDAFGHNGDFIGWKRLKEHLIHLRNEQSSGWIKQTVTSLHKNQGTETYSFPMLSENGGPLTKDIRTILQNERMRLPVPIMPSPDNARAQSGTPGALQTASFGLSTPSPSARISTYTPHGSSQSTIPLPAQLGAASNLISGEVLAVEQAPKNDLLARQLGKMQLDTHIDRERPTLRRGESSRPEYGRQSPDSVYTPNSAEDSDVAEADFPAAVATADFDAMDVLLAAYRSAGGGDTDSRAGIFHAPLVDESIVRRENTTGLIPQYGLVGTHDQNTENTQSKLFLNTNVPFSAFVCGVQGSGKSHTTSCILENCLVPSRHLGVLQEPLSALVFSYGLFTGDGAGFSISEAAFLGAPSLPPANAHVKNIHVLVCETNLRKIRRLYERLPNVTVSAFKLDPRNLDIGT
jgi:hypothetical protein